MEYHTARPGRGGNAGDANAAALVDDLGRPARLEYYAIRRGADGF